jgi:hypothetical protein
VVVGWIYATTREPQRAERSSAREVVEDPISVATYTLVGW